MLGAETQDTSVEKTLVHAVELHRAGEIRQAQTLYLGVLARQPDHADALHLAGVVAHQLGRPEEGLRLLHRAIELDPSEPMFHTNLGVMLMAEGDFDAASRAHLRATLLKRGPRAVDDDLVGLRSTTLAKLDHDIEQLSYLEAHGRLPRSLATARLEYQEVRDEIAENADAGTAVELTPDQRDRIGASYNRAVHLADSPALSGPAVNPELDTDAILARYRAHAPGLTWFDEFLTPEALTSLRRFCLESTVWFDMSHEGYLGATIEEGFVSPLILQIVEETRTRLHEIIQGHQLKQLWAFKYDSRVPGITPHADFAAVNLNFWITPDEALEEPGRGGLKIHQAEAPKDWSFEEYNQDASGMRAHLARHSRGEWVVPHKQNRAVIFHSNLIHETDSVPFRAGYENRRINITMLFGNRS